MGSGKNGSFDIMPDFQKWAILCTHNQDINNINLNKKSGYYLPNFIRIWIKFFAREHFVVILESVAGHGTWDKQKPFEPFLKSETESGPIAVLTRATIRLNKLKSFWTAVRPVSETMKQAEGLIYTAGIGEIPWIKQASPE